MPIDSLNPADKPVALVTGGAKRIGAAISKDLAAYGFKVAVHYSQSSLDAENLCDDIQKSGGAAYPFRADLRHDKLTNLFQCVENKLGLVQLLVNNASVFHDDEIGTLKEQIWDEHFDLHLKIPVLLAQEMANSFKVHKITKYSGLIVNMIDQRVLRLNPNFFSYTLSKSSLWTATQTLAQALAPSIRVNAIGPGPSLKNISQTDNDFEKQCLSLPLNHGPKLEEFGNTIRYLWENKSVTGQIFALDGGQHLMWQTPDLDWDKGNIG